jgi:hypothetical protein
MGMKFSKKLVLYVSFQNPIFDSTLHPEFVCKYIFPQRDRFEKRLEKWHTFAEFSKSFYATE